MTDGLEATNCDRSIQPKRPPKVAVGLIENSAYLSLHAAISKGAHVEIFLHHHLCPYIVGGDCIADRRRLRAYHS
ncbi:hypothetical protein [Sphingobium sp. LMC3-1-1.1]|uniref:hypothetical protein n=1 Tax=unclassified Sphingobium TaxID=2611147 RepID=UPI003422DAF5